MSVIGLDHWTGLDFDPTIATPITFPHNKTTLTIVNNDSENLLPSEWADQSNPYSALYMNHIIIAQT